MILQTVLFYSFDSFHTSVSWWLSTGVWMTASFLKFPGLFSVFQPITTMVWFELSPHVMLFPNAFGDCTDGITVTFMFHSFFNSQVKSRYFLFIFFQFLSVISRDSKVHSSASFPFLLIITWSGRLAEIRWIIVISIIIYGLRVYPISVSWWSFTRVWLAASLLKSPGLFSVFWLISIML